MVLKLEDKMLFYQKQCLEKIKGENFLSREEVLDILKTSGVTFIPGSSDGVGFNFFNDAFSIYFDYFESLFCTDIGFRDNILIDSISFEGVGKLEAFTLLSLKPEFNERLSNDEIVELVLNKYFDEFSAALCHHLAERTTKTLLLIQGKVQRMGDEVSSVPLEHLPLKVYQSLFLIDLSYVCFNYEQHLPKSSEDFYEVVERILNKILFYIEIGDFYRADLEQILQVFKEHSNYAPEPGIRLGGAWRVVPANILSECIRPEKLVMNKSDKKNPTIDARELCDIIHKFYLTG